MCVCRRVQHGTTIGEGNGAMIFDLHSGALTKGTSFIDAYKAMQQDPRGQYFTRADFELLVETKERIEALLSDHFNVTGLRLTKPTFFARLDGDHEAKVMNDEYWHPHVDTIAYGSFAFTGLLYLSEQGDDFQGGDFVFLDGAANYTVTPVIGRLLLFTSGAENAHQVRRVTRGARTALTIAFTCDAAAAADAFIAPHRDMFVDLAL